MNKRMIALDVGDRRIGIAVSDPLGITAQPLETYTRVGYGPDTRHIAALAEKYETDQILCGHKQADHGHNRCPDSADGEEII